jgi:hypothetical protein
MGADGPIPDQKQASDQPDQAVDQRGSDTANWVQLDLEALDMGLDPAPMLGVISDLLRRYADALTRPDAAAP